MTKSPDRLRRSGLHAPSFALADLLLVDGDPLRRIEDAAAVQTIIAGGVVYTPQELQAPFAGRNARRRLSCVEIAPSGAPHPLHWWHGEAYVEQSRAACCCAGSFA